MPESAAAELEELQAENARLLRLLKLTRAEAAPPRPAQAGLFDAPPDPVHAGSLAEEKVALFGALFAARTDIYAVRWENDRAARAGWLPAVRGGWRRGVPHAERDYLPLTAEVRIEAQFTALRYFTLDGTDHASHKEQASMIRRYIIWRNNHACDERLSRIVDRANVA